MKMTSEDPDQAEPSERQDTECSASQSSAQVWQHQQMLFFGQPIIFTASQPEAEREI
jgi:hypothetical protein